MTKPMPNAERVSKPQVSTLVITKPEQGWFERTPLCAIYAVKVQDSTTLGKLTTSCQATLVACWLLLIDRAMPAEATSHSKIRLKTEIQYSVRIRLKNLKIRFGKIRSGFGWKF
jgi:hypothetical protein